MAREAQARPLRERFLVRLVRERWLIYFLGLLIWAGTATYLPTLFKLPASTLAYTFWSPLLMGYILLLLNLFATVLRRHEHLLESKGEKGEIEPENTRIGVVQNYGGSVLLAASIVAGITVARGTAGSQFFLVYLGGSITVAILSLVPIWMPNDDKRPLLLLRYVKTVLLIFSVALLSEALAVLLDFPT